MYLFMHGSLTQCALVLSCPSKTVGSRQQIVCVVRNVMEMGWLKLVDDGKGREGWWDYRD